MLHDWPTQGVSIVIPTYKRPESLIRALKSVEPEARQHPLCEIVVTDNDPLASAKDAVSAFIKNTDTSLIYIHEPKPGVSNARNTALKKARGRYIAFLDDDMEALPGWVSALLKTSDYYKAGLVFGPIEAVMPEGKAEYPFMASAFERKPYTETQLISEGIGTGGSLIDRLLCDLPSPAFNPALNQTGGEDDAFFKHVIHKGAKAAWAQNAKCLEHVPQIRATLSYIWLRNFAYGQSPSQEAIEKGLKGLPRLIFWMAVGTVQSLLNLPALIMGSLVKSPKRVTALAKFAQGAGKIFWLKAFSPKLYGN